MSTYHDEGIFTRVITTGEDAIRYDNTLWDDLRVPVSATVTGGTKIPGFSQFKDNGAGSTGVFVRWFDKALEEQLFFFAQMPHKYKLGTTIYPHVHWLPSVNGGAGTVVNWGLEYNFALIGGVFGNTTIISANAHTPVEDPLVADKQYITPLSTISGTGLTSVSAMICGRIFRDATGALGTDDYDADAGLLEIDFHYEIDSPGSREVYVK
jgi:hypothetical protein